MNSLATLFKIEAAIRKASSQNWQVTCGYATSNSTTIFRFLLSATLFCSIVSSIVYCYNFSSCK